MIPVQLQVGDVLLYRPSGFLGWAIAVKTASRIASHVEVAVKAGTAVSARQEGVNYFPTRWSGLSRVLRPNHPVDMAKGLAWFDAHARFQRYDYAALFRFFTIGKQSLDKQMCSEVCTRLLRAAAIGWTPFGSEDADLIAPRDFLKSDEYTLVWSDTP